jgi:hypothetical protein
MIRQVVLAHLLLASLCAGQATITDPVDWPGITNLPTCVSSVFVGCIYDCGFNILPSEGCIACGVGCDDWSCACSAEYTPALSLVAAVASYRCSNALNFVPSATSIFSSFCEQLTASPTFAPASPSQTGAATQPANDNNGNSNSNVQSAGVCNFGANSTGNQCNEDNPKVNGGTLLSVPHMLLFGCLTVVSGFVLLGRDDACNYGSNAHNNSCNDNVIDGGNATSSDSSSSSTARDLGIGLGIGIPSFIVAFVGLVVMIRHYGRKERDREIAAMMAGQASMVGSGYGRAY